MHQICRYRSTVIRNLPQLQKLDNVAVQPDDMAEAMRRGIELVHPLDRDTAYPPAQSMGYSQVSRIVNGAPLADAVLISNYE